MGFSSRVAGAPEGDGSRPVASVVLRSGSAYGGLEAGQPGLLALATVLTDPTNPGQPRHVSARLTRGPTLPLRVPVAPFLPLATESTYAADARTFSPGQPSWNALTSAGAEFARLVLTGSQQRHLVYFTPSGSQTTLQLPPGPSAVSADPADEVGVRLSVVVFDLAAGVTVEDAVDFAGVNLSTLSSGVDGYSRYQP
jgi:hypothetical protein